MTIALLHGTPLWVWFVLLFLVLRGMVAMRPNTITPMRLMLMPIVFTAWSVQSLSRLGVVDPTLSLGVLIGLVAGLLIGWYTHAGIKGLWFDRVANLIHRPGSFRQLIVALVGFTIKYSLGASLGFHPHLARVGDFVLFDGIGNGLVCGVMWAAAASQLLLAWRTAPAITSSKESDL